MTRGLTFVSNKTLLNPADLYQHAHRGALAAVDDPTTYSLADIVGNDDKRQAIFSTAFLSIIPLHATVDGCAQALRNRSITAAQVAAAHPPAPVTSRVSATDMATARHWLTTTLEKDLDRDQQQLMIVDHLLENGWETHPARLSSLMTAVIETAATAASSRP